MVDTLLYFVVGFIVAIYTVFRLMLFDRKMHPEKYKNSDNYLMTFLCTEEEDTAISIVLTVLIGTCLWPILFIAFTVFDILWTVSIYITKKIKEKEANTDVSQSTRGDKG